MAQVYLATRFRIHSVFTNNPTLPFYRSLGPRFVLWPFTTHATFPFPLGILNSEFHSNFLSHLVFLCSVRRLLVTVSVVPSSPIFVTLMKEVLSSSETSVLTRATRRNIQEDTILHVMIDSNKKKPNLMGTYLPKTLPILGSVFQQTEIIQQILCLLRN
jgi:hypothetical protein